jgi:RNA polymerase sigma-70 factor (ECF subfamily)
MDSKPHNEITSLLLDSSTGDEAADAQQLVPLVYDELRGIAQRYFRQERPDHTLQPTAIVHEAYLRLVDESRVDWQGRTHFRAVCAKVMRRVLIDYARARSRDRRGGGDKPILLDSVVAQLHLERVGAIELSDALDRLAQLDERQAQIVELRFYGGLTVDEVAKTLDLSKRTVEGEWTHAKAWLKAQFDQEARS